MRPIFMASPRGAAVLASTFVMSFVLALFFPACAQDNDQKPLPPIDVIATRTGGGITGASTTIITSQEIERAPEATIQDILSREAGIQTSSFYGGVNGTGTTVDIRGFGINAPSNVLVLVDGRRFNDNDLPGFDFSLIPRNSIERIEITRGNSGAVLYGDGAVGGVINIVTKNGVGAAPNARVEGAFGTFRTKEAKISASASYSGLSAAGFGNAFQSDGFRANNLTRQQQAVGDLRYTNNVGSIFFNIAADDLRQRLPGPRNILNGPFVGFIDEYNSDPRGTDTPSNYSNRQNTALRGGVTRNLWNGAELTIDGSYREKHQQAGFFNPFNTLFVVADAPNSYVATELTTASVTPRLNIDQVFDAFRVRMIGGVDVYKTSYHSDRSLFQGAAPNHVYDIDQLTTAAYVQPTVTLWQNTDISVGGRVQRNALHARDVFDPAAPGPPFPTPQGIPLDTSETRHATHVGIEQRLNAVFSVFGRMAQSFRVPNVDERVGSGPFLGAVTNFSLRTQRSHDYEGGVRVNAGPFHLQSSAYRMYLVDELHLNPITFANVNLDPTLRYGVENTVSYDITESLSLKATASYTRAKFRSGPFMGNDVPLVARVSGSAGVSWDIYRKYLIFDGVVRLTGKRFLDGDEANVGRMMVPGTAIIDVRLGGEIENFYWSLSVQNLFNRMYFDYGLDNSFTGNLSLSLYPLPGRTFMGRAGVKFSAGG
jgi:iron complex outermembrane receptor protein